MILTVSRQNDQPLVDQIVAGIKKQIDDNHLPAGVRRFAERYRVSRFTVVEAYDRSVAMGYLHSRRGAGFYAQAPQNPHHRLVTDQFRRGLTCPLVRRPSPETSGKVFWSDGVLLSF